MIKNIKLADGYVLNTADGYSFTSNWVDLNVIPTFAISVVFTGGTPTGTLTLEQSCDAPFAQIPNFPNSAAVQGGNPKDLATILGSSQAIAAAGVYTYNLQNQGYRFVRVKYSASGNSVTTLDIYFCGRGYSN